MVEKAEQQQDLDLKFASKKIRSDQVCFCKRDKLLKKLSCYTSINIKYFLFNILLCTIYNYFIYSIYYLVFLITMFFLY